MRTIEVTNLKDEITKLIKQVVEEMVEDARQYKWIPVSERLPEGEMEVLLTVEIQFESGKKVQVVELAYYDLDIGRWCKEEQDGPVEILHHPVAWMPLPEQYKEAE